MRSGSDLQRDKQQPDLILCGLKFGSACQKRLRRRSRKWAFEEPKLDNGRKLRGICFIDPGDGRVLGNHKKNGRQKLEVPTEAAMPCKMGTKKALE